MSLDFILEWSATLLSLIFLVGIIQRKVWAWPAGTLSSALSVVYSTVLDSTQKLDSTFFTSQWDFTVGLNGARILHKRRLRLSIFREDAAFSPTGNPLALILGYGLNALPALVLPISIRLLPFWIMGYLAGNQTDTNCFSLLDSLNIASWCSTE